MIRRRNSRHLQSQISVEQSENSSSPQMNATSNVVPLNSSSSSSQLLRSTTNVKPAVQSAYSPQTSPTITLNNEFSLPINPPAQKNKYQLPRGFSLSSRINSNKNASSSNAKDANELKRKHKYLSPSKFLTSPIKTYHNSPSSTTSSPSPSSASNYPIEGGYYETSLCTKRAIFRQLRSQTATIENPTDEVFAKRVQYNGLIVMDPIPLITPAHAPLEQQAEQERRRMYHNTVNDVSLLLFNEYLKKSTQMKDQLIRSLEKQIVQEEKAKNPNCSKPIKPSIFTKNLKRKLVRNIKQQQQFQKSAEAANISQGMNANSKNSAERIMTTTQNQFDDNSYTFNSNLYDPQPALTIRQHHDAMPLRCLPKSVSGAKSPSVSSSCSSRNASVKQFESIRSTLSNRSMRKSDVNQPGDDIVSQTLRVPPGSAEGTSRNSTDRLAPLLHAQNKYNVLNQRRVQTAKDSSSIIMSGKIGHGRGPYNPDVQNRNVVQQELQQNQLDCQSSQFYVTQMQLAIQSNYSTSFTALDPSQVLEQQQVQSQKQQVQQQLQQSSGFYPIQQRVFSANSGIKRSTIENIYSARLQSQSQQNHSLLQSKLISTNASHDSLMRSTQNSLQTASLQQFLRGMSETQSSGGFSARI